MYLARVMTSGIMKPRVRAQLVEGMSAVPTRREVGGASGKALFYFLFGFSKPLSCRHSDSVCPVSSGSKISGRKKGKLCECVTASEMRLRMLREHYPLGMSFVVPRTLF